MKSSEWSLLIRWERNKRRENRSSMNLQQNLNFIFRRQLQSNKKKSLTLSLGNLHNSHHHNLKSIWILQHNISRIQAYNPRGLQDHPVKVPPDSRTLLLEIKWTTSPTFSGPPISQKGQVSLLFQLRWKTSQLSNLLVLKILKSLILQTSLEHLIPRSNLRQLQRLLLQCPLLILPSRRKTRQRSVLLTSYLVLDDASIIIQSILKYNLLMSRRFKVQKKSSIPSLLSCEVELNKVHDQNIMDAVRRNDKNLKKEMKMAILKSIEPKYLE